MAQANQANQANQDPLENLITDGRVHTRPIRHYGLPTIIDIDLEMLYATLTTRLGDLLQNDIRIRNRYTGTNAVITQTITNDISALCTYMVGQTYNRLRSILERKDPTARLTRMNPRCPIPANLEFPTWISSTLSSIGPCRIDDGPTDSLVVYATTAATMNNYGRAAPVVFNEGNYYRITTVFRDIHLNLAPFDFTGQAGSYFSTLEPVLGEYVWSLYGTVHHSHYENEDFARIALVTSNLGVTPFGSIATTIGYVNNTATLDALAAVAAPEGIPAGQTAASTGRLVGAHFNVNFFGIHPATAATATAEAQPRGMYVIGRGVYPYYQCSFANNIATTEVLEVLRYGIMRTNN